MSIFTRSDFVEEFAFRTQSNYFSLMIAQAEKENQHDSAREYKEKLIELQQEMTRQQYIANDSYFEVTQLINSLIGLLIFPEQRYYEELKQAQLSMENDFAALNRIIKSDNYYCSYKKTDEASLDKALQKLCYKNTKNSELLKNVFGKFPPEEESPYNILKHMRNAVAHEKVGIIPVNRGEKITSVIFEDCGYAKLKNRKNGISAFYESPRQFDNRRDRDNPEFGYFKLEIPVEELEPVLMEISNVILRIARTG